MSQISSINFKKSNTIQAQHNDRTLSPNYLIGGNVEVNRKSNEALDLKEQIIQEAIEAYSNRTGQKFQAKSYEWSAVVNLKPDSTMQDLENLAAHFNKKYGFQCYQIAIHRDEGYIDEQGNKQINHHAHLEFITLDKNTGINRWRLGGKGNARQSFIKMQTEVAEILKMQRGIDKRLSGAKRIEPRIYAKMKEDSKAELRNERAKNEALQAELSQKQIKERLEQERKAWIAEGGHTKEEYAELRKLKEQAYKKIEDLEKNIAELRNLRKKDFETFGAEQNKRIEFEAQNDKLLLESKNKDKAIQNLENQNKTLRIENKALNEKILEQSNKIDLRAENESLKQESFTLEQVKQVIESKDFLESKRIDIGQTMWDFEHSPQKAAQVQCNRVNIVGKNYTELENALEINKSKNLGLERFFSLEPYEDICKRAKEWIMQKAKELNLTRDRGISR